jgi:hypothetical protein
VNDLPADSFYSDNQHKNIHDLKTVNSGVDSRKILLTETFIVLAGFSGMHLIGMKKQKG